MRTNAFKQKNYKRNIIRIAIIAICIFVIILITIIVTSNSEREQLFLEGKVKSVPLITNETTKRLGNLYISLNREFERQIKEMEEDYASRYNKRGDKIYYGVNGKENDEYLINDDYVNGIQSITYIKGSAKDRKDGESNFVDMISVLSSALGADMDKYEADKIDTLFSKLFWLSHTFTGTTTELYPCKHGCAWVKYYCGDRYVQGEYGGDVVPFFKCDAYMGMEGEYGLMYDPFLASNYNYTLLKQKALDTSYLVTTFRDKGNYEARSDGESVSYVQVYHNGRAVTGDDEIFHIQEPEGICPVCGNGEEVFDSTTRKFAGCNPELTCYHGAPKTESDEDGNTRLIAMHYMGQEKENDCSNANVENICNYEPPEEGEEETHACANPDIGCDGYYECGGHEHYSCPGHILVCCFGHTNLNLSIKIMYYEEMLDKLKEIIS